VEQVHVIRHKVLVEGRSQRQVANQLGMSRLTVKKYLRQAVPVRCEAQPRARPGWDRVAVRIQRLLAESARWTGGKQQLTATGRTRCSSDGHHVGSRW
jgi:transposase